MKLILCRIIRLCRSRTLHGCAAATLSCAVAVSVRAQAPATTQRSTLPASQPSTATTPTSRAATLPVLTLDTPRDALKFFAAALRDGDVERMHRAVLSGGDAEERMVTAIADMSRALAVLHTSAAKVFGADAAHRFTDDTAAGFEQTLTRIDAADVVVERDVATVRYADDRDNPYELRRVGQEWKVPATQFTQGAEPKVLERRIVELTVQTRIVLELSREITDGKHKSAEAAGLVWRSKMMAALSGDAPTSRPGTQPTSKQVGG